jgi:hypothetical protein
MKAKYLPIIVIGMLTGLYSCKKDLPLCCGLNPPPVSIFGKWNIVSDSTYVGAGFSNHPVNYAGKAGDYFDVRTDGYIYTKEGAALDTLSYNLVSDTGIVIASFGLIANGVPAISHITNLTWHSATIASPVALTPGGVFGRKISLSR